MKSSNRVYKFSFFIALFIILCCTGCIKEKMNKSDYNLAEIFDGYKWTKEGNYYTKNLMSNDKYTYYFDSTDYQKNYFSMLSNGEEAKYYYAIDLLQNKNCEVSLDDLLKENNCSKEDVAIYNRLIFAFKIMNEDMKFEKKDLFIVESDLKNKVIHIETN